MILISQEEFYYSNFLRSNTIRQTRFSGGRHFIETHSWFTAINDTLNRFRILAKNGDFSFLLYPDDNPIPDYKGDEQLLYNLIEQAGLPILSHITFENGIHIGLARGKKLNHLRGNPDDWKQQYIDCFENDIIFQNILSLLNEEVKKEYIFIYDTFKRG